MISDWCNFIQIKPHHHLKTSWNGFVGSQLMFCHYRKAFPASKFIIFISTLFGPYRHTTIMSDDDTDLMPQVFVVEGDDDEFDLDIPPTSGMDYLRRVQ